MSEYSQIVASDVVRDGLGLELWNGGQQVAEIFRSDREQKLTITLWEEDLPLEVIDGFIADAKNKLLPFAAD